MRQFLIRYRRGSTDADTWHRDIAAFIAALDGDAELSGKISYRCMRIADSDDYLHIAAPADEAAIKTLQSRDYFKRYNERTRQVAADGKVEVLKLDVVAETKNRG